MSLSRSENINRAVNIFCALVFLLCAANHLSAQLQRVPNTTLQLPQQLPVFGYTATNAFGTLTFNSPIAIATPPGETNRVFVLERSGIVTVVTNLAAPNRTVFMDITSKIAPIVCEEGLLGIAFHPGYATNRYFFLFYSTSLNTSQGNGLHERVARFQTTSTNANVALANTELPLITQYDEACNHNGGCLQFGPDGYLYVSLGDEGNQNDSFNNSQRIDKDFFSGILRIDVDKRAANLVPTTHLARLSTTNYFIPADNPFVGATTFNGSSISTSALRSEFWAIGLRNPWRFSFDTQTGMLLCGDVGGDVREEVDVIIKGGNYGWAIREGTTTGPKSGTLLNPVTPILDIAHTASGTNAGNCITGGVMYRGNRIAQLNGKYVFCDYGSGNFWSLTPNGTNAVGKQYLMNDAGIVSFGTDPLNADVLMCDMAAGQVKRLIYATNFTGAALPATLAATGAFTNTTTLAPAPGVIPYDLNVPFWSDNAIKSRWVSIPNTNLTITFDRESNWLFPTGTVWTKHFELELTNGVPTSRKRLETRFLVKNQGGLYGVTYRWGSSTTNATLVPPEGMDENFVINDGGNLRTQVWHYPSQGECLVCHTPQAGFALGFNTPQLNRDFDYGSGNTNQIATLNRAGYFNTNVTGIHTLHALASATNNSVSREFRVRSYLAANCSQCHQPGGAANALWDARITTPTSLAGLINGALISSGDTNNRVIAPGSPTNSMLLTRISTRGPMQMPPLASTVIDTQSVALVSAWITNDLPNYQTFAQWQSNYFGSTNAASAGADADPDNDGAKNQLEFLTGTNPTNALDSWTISALRGNNSLNLSFNQISNRAFEAQFSGSLTGAWQALDIPANAPFFSITNKSVVIPDTLDQRSNRYYRVRVREP